MNKIISLRQEVGVRDAVGFGEAARSIGFVERAARAHCTRKQVPGEPGRAVRRDLPGSACCSAASRFNRVDPHA